MCVSWARIAPWTQADRRAIDSGVQITFTIDSDNAALREAAKRLDEMAGSTVTQARERENEALLDEVESLKADLEGSRALTIAREVEAEELKVDLAAVTELSDGRWSTLSIARSEIVDLKRDNYTLKEALDGSKRDLNAADEHEVTGPEPDLSADIKAFEVPLACGDVVKIDNVTDTGYTAELPGECHTTTTPAGPPPPPPPAPLRAEGPKDSEGVAWDPALHTSGQTKKMDGTWKKKPNRGGAAKTGATRAECQAVIGKLIADPGVDDQAVSDAVADATDGKGMAEVTDGPVAAAALGALQAFAVLNGVDL